MEFVMTILEGAWRYVTTIRIADYLDIALMAYCCYLLLRLVRSTRAESLVKGIMVFLLALWISHVFKLNGIYFILNHMLDVGILALIVLFQPEIRRVLEQLGRGAKMEHFQSDGEENQRIISEITQCLTSLSRRRVGALIVFERRTGLKDVMETGTRLDSTISAPLLENIFEPNTPLHDGAVIIRGTRIVSAACMLTTLSESNAITRDLGTRHRAAIGISETTDALVLIVSEETGVISMARDGKLTRHLDAKAIGEILSTMYHQPQDGLYVRAKNWLKGRLNHGRAEN